MYVLYRFVRKGYTHVSLGEGMSSPTNYDYNHRWESRDMYVKDYFLQLQPVQGFSSLKKS